ncbi:MAG: 1-aminocyclopropane-1-carboxylate deaminase/D-cysteine desulfhydrase [Flavobacteriales bacterium]
MMFKGTIPIQKIDELNGVKLFIQREDLRHPFISGNKWWKLKCNIEEAKKHRAHTLLTFGGAFSNHLAATAFAGKENGFKTIAIVRGEEVENATLSFCKEQGMELRFVSRDHYRLKKSDRREVRPPTDESRIWLIPEGGANEFGVKGCAEILDERAAEFDYIIAPCGTANTLSGLIISSNENHKILGFPVLKGAEFLQQEVENNLQQFSSSKKNWQLIFDYHFGGYAKISDELIAFILDFQQRYKIPLDAVYTGKMMYGVFDLIGKYAFPVGSKILMIHTGGLQGNKGMKERFGVDLTM